MNELAVLPAPPADIGLAAELAQRTEERILTPARARGYELRLVGATVLPQRQVICRSQHGTWLFVNHWDDPTAREYGGKIPIPAAEHSKLTALADAGVRPDFVWMAHELPASWQDGDQLDQLVPPPAHLRQKDERLLRGLRAVSGAALKVAGVTLSAAGAMVGALEGIGLDPIVLGGVQHPDLPIVAWVVLAQWQWT